MIIFLVEKVNVNCNTYKNGWIYLLVIITIICYLNFTEPAVGLSKIILSLHRLLTIMFTSKCNFFCIYHYETFKIMSLLCLAATLVCSLSISSNMSYSTTSVSAIFGASSSITTTNNNFLTYQDNILGIKIDYPTGWIHEL